MGGVIVRLAGVLMVVAGVATAALFFTPPAAAPSASLRQMNIPPPVPFPILIRSVLPQVNISSKAPIIKKEIEQDDAPLYLDPTAQAIRIERDLRANGRLEEADLIAVIARQPQAIWVVGDVEKFVESIASHTLAAASEGSVPVFVLYQFHQISVTSYRIWVEAFAREIGTSSAWVLLEPDSLAGLPSDDDERGAVLQSIREAVLVLRRDAPLARIYLDGGHNAWRSAADQAEILRAAGIAETNGFFLNVSNYRSTASEVAYGKKLSELLDGAHFVVDTGRNGAGAPGEGWCNERGRALGPRPSRETGEPLVDAFLWVKPPGESDGLCNGGPPAGKFWLEYALELVENAAAVTHE